MIKRSILDHSKDGPKFPYNPPEFASQLVKGPICKLFITTFMILHYRMKKYEFRYAVTDSSRLACKNWALESDWEGSLIPDLDYQNAKQVLNEMMLWCKIQNKKMMRYVNKQNMCVNHMDVEDKARNAKIMY